MQRVWFAHAQTIVGAAVVMLGLAGAFGIGSLTAQAADPLVAIDDAYVSRDASGWTIGTRATTLRLGLDPATGILQVRSLESPGAEQAWLAGTTPDSTFVAQTTRRLAPGQAGLPYRRARVDTAGGAVRLHLEFEDATSRMLVARSYGVYPGSSGVETWTTFTADPAAPAVPLSDIGVWQLSVQATATNWLTGLGAPASEGGRFVRRQQAVAPRLQLGLGSTGRSSELAVPAVWLDGPAGHLLGGLLWSGQWSLSVGEPAASGFAVARMSLGNTATTVRAGQPFETPHGFVGTARPGALNLAAAWQAYTQTGVRHGRPLGAPVTFNTWFAYGNRIDEQTIRDDMDRVAPMGVELFVVDAGWYPGGTRPDDYTTGLGLWQADSKRFPSGLPALRDYAHALGLKFGIWVEPERVDTTTVNRPGLAKERFLATTGGRYNPGGRNESADAAQVCLGDAEARQWVFDQLVRFLDEVRPDYLKWDNNFWINCDRSGHGHEERDGSLSHVKGLYGMLAALRERYPQLAIEDCASGGNRLDLGMLQYTDSAWMDDVSGPSTHVRHNLEGLSAIFPPAYLLSFVMDDPAEPIHGAADLNNVLRSRMPGMLGFSLRPGEFSDAERSTMRREILFYRRNRPVLRDGSAIMLTPQVPASGSADADAIEIVSAGTGSVAIYEFAGEGSSLSPSIWPVSLDPDAFYSVRGRRGAAVSTGSGIMANGIEPSVGYDSAARITILNRLESDPALAAR